MQRSYTSLHLHSPIFFLAAERQNLRRSAASSLRDASACCNVVGLRGNPHHGIFFSNPPNRESSANAVTGRTLRRQVRPRGCCCANAATCSPAVFACLLFTSSENGITPCSILVEGRATVTTAALSWLHQRHCVCAASAALPNRRLHPAHSLSQS
jgi:hypothetical protein